MAARNGSVLERLVPAKIVHFKTRLVQFSDVDCIKKCLFKWCYDIGGLDIGGPDSGGIFKKDIGGPDIEGAPTLEVYSYK
jgi:hypothetical protein